VHISKENLTGPAMNSQVVALGEQLNILVDLAQKNARWQAKSDRRQVRLTKLLEKIAEKVDVSTDGLVSSTEDEDPVDDLAEELEAAAVCLRWFCAITSNSRPRWLEAQRHELLAVVLEPCLLSVSSCVLSGCLCRSPWATLFCARDRFYRRRLRILTCPPTRRRTRVRSQRGDDVRAERCLRVGRDQAVLRSVLGVHVVDFKAV
jgi:hypothetical protein